MGNPYPVFVYSNYESLKPAFSTGHTKKGRIANWMDRLGEYNMKVLYRPSRDQHIGIADGLSRMPTRLTSFSTIEDQERLAIAASHITFDQ